MSGRSRQAVWVGRGSKVAEQEEGASPSSLPGNMTNTLEVEKGRVRKLSGKLEQIEEEAKTRIRKQEEEKKKQKKPADPKINILVPLERNSDREGRAYLIVGPGDREGATWSPPLSSASPSSSWVPYAASSPSYRGRGARRSPDRNKFIGTLCAQYCRASGPALDGGKTTEHCCTLTNGKGKLSQRLGMKIPGD